MMMSSPRARGLAALPAVDIWLDGSLLAAARATLEAKGGPLAELDGCRFCLSFHAAWAAALLLATPRWLDSLLPACKPYTAAWCGALTLRAFAGPGELLTAALATSKLARILHDWARNGSAGERASDTRLP
jgi:hypothetical protein